MYGMVAAVTWLILDERQPWCLFWSNTDELSQIRRLLYIQFFKSSQHKAMLLDKWFTELRLIFQLFIASHNVVNKFCLASFTCFQSHVFYWLWNKVTLWHVYCERQSRQWKVEESNWILWIFCRRTVLPTFVQEILRQRSRKKSFFSSRSNWNIKF